MDVSCEWKEQWEVGGCPPSEARGFPPLRRPSRVFWTSVCRLRLPLEFRWEAPTDAVVLILLGNLRLAAFPPARAPAAPGWWENGFSRENESQPERVAGAQTSPASVTDHSPQQSHQTWPHRGSPAMPQTQRSVIKRLEERACSQV